MCTGLVCAQRSSVSGWRWGEGPGYARLAGAQEAVPYLSATDTKRDHLLCSCKPGTCTEVPQLRISWLDRHWARELWAALVAVCKGASAWVLAGSWPWHPCTICFFRGNDNPMYSILISPPQHREVEKAQKGSTLWDQAFGAFLFIQNDDEEKAW